MQTAEWEAVLAQRVQQQLGVDLDTLLEPISDTQPSGEDLRGNGVYSALKEARRNDDATLPQGVWTYELKRADWSKVVQVGIDALSHQSKDLQIAVWLLEAHIHQQGFAGIAPGVFVLQKLCELYWETGLYPSLDDGDVEYRTNLISWVNEKLQPVIRLIPITQSQRDDREFSWADWEMALRHEQLRKKLNEPPADAVMSTQEFFSYVASSSTDFYVDQYQHISAALDALQSLEEILDHLCGRDAPTLHNLTQLLTDIHSMIASQLANRGIPLYTVGSDGTIEASDGTLDDADDASDGSGGEGSGGSGGGGGPVKTRAEAYAKLEEIANFLMRLEPHSPVPYLLKRAIYWGSLDTRQLYQHLFIQFQGQLNIFEVLGLDAPDIPES